ncbi:sigma-70 family RNA polymerase sigma factor [Micromonospora musae]|uniref:sigma-70 family RNA polymerase sigma factor n=1 Tax=Micromonospora musae TaxID=1894970 RepID=UPI0033C4BB73
MATHTRDLDDPDDSPRPRDVEKLRQIFEERSGSLLRFLRRINACRPQIVEDLLQETMLKVWRHIGDVPTDEKHIQSWLFTIARNVSADEARKRGRRPQEYQSERELQNYPAPVDPMDYVVAAESMLDAFRKLSPERRRALEEIYVKSRSAGDAAVLLSVPIGTAKSRAFYAMDSLRAAVFST